MSFPVVPSGLRSQAWSSVTKVRVQTLLLPFYFFCGHHLKFSTMLVGSQLVKLLLVSILKELCYEMYQNSNCHQIERKQAPGLRPGSDAELFMSRT